MRVSGLGIDQFVLNHTLKNQALAQKAIEKLVTGKQINKASDDPSKILRMSRFEAQLRGNQVAQKNIQDALAMSHTISNALSHMSDIGQRLRELAVQYQSDTLNDDDRKEIQNEAKALFEEMNHTIKNTKYNGISLFEHEKFNIQTGANSKESFEFRMPKQIVADIYKKGKMNHDGKEKKESHSSPSVVYVDNRFINIHNEYYINSGNNNVVDSNVNSNNHIKNNSQVDDRNENNQNTQIENSYKENEIGNNFLPESENSENDKQLQNQVDDVNNQSQEKERKTLIGGLLGGVISLVGGVVEGVGELIEETGDSIENIGKRLKGETKQTTQTNQSTQSLLSPSSHNPIDNKQMKEYSEGLIINSTNEHNEVFLYESEKEGISKTEITTTSIEETDRNAITLTSDNDSSVEPPNMNEKNHSAGTNTSELNEFSYGQILNPDFIERNILDPINKARALIGVQESILEKRLNYEMEKESVLGQSLSNIQDVNIAKELMNKFKHEMLMANGMSLLYNNLENRRANIMKLLG